MYQKERTIFKFLNVFVFSVIFNNFFLSLLFKQDETITASGLTNLQNDFINIAFPFTFQINSLFIAILISILISLVIKFFVIDNFSLDDPVVILKTIIKLFFIYSGSLFAVLYLLRLYSLSRGIVLISIFIFPFLSFLLISLLHLELYKRMNNLLVKFFPPVLLLLMVLFFFFQRDDSESTYSIVSAPTTSSTIFSGIVDQECKEWKGSENYSECLSGVEIQILDSFEGMLTNVVTFNENIYILESKGKVFDYFKNTVFLDLTLKVGVFEEFSESGLFSLAFHPTDNFFLISYSDIENNLVVEKYTLNTSFEPDLNNPEVIVKIPSTQCCHYSGNIIWSNFFEDFLLSVGDMQNQKGLLHSDPLDTTSPKGKVLFLNKKISSPDLLAIENTSQPRRDILAFGLRNPWKTSEYKDYLFVPDVGRSAEEELNIVNLNTFNMEGKPYLFGWPHFEGTRNNDLKFNQILFHSEGTSENIKSYVEENSITPNVYYSHSAPENYRAAIIGGGVVADNKSKYFEHYFFADYLSNEMFAYDFKNDKLIILPLNNVGGNITSLTIHPTLKETILITTASGNLLQIQLP